MGMYIFSRIWNMTRVSWEHTRQGDKKGMQLIAINHVSLASPANTYFCSSQRVTEESLCSLSALLKALITKPSSLPFGACYCPLVQLWPRALESHVHDSSASRHWKNKRAQGHVRSVTTAAWLHNTRQSSLLIAYVSPELLHWSPCGAGLTHLAKWHHHPGSRIILPFPQRMLCYQAKLLCWYSLSLGCVARFCRWLAEWSWAKCLTSLGSSSLVSKIWEMC